jgi:hypothetical protein
MPTLAFYLTNFEDDDDGDGFDYTYEPPARQPVAHRIPEPPRDEGDTPVVPMRAAIVLPEDIDTSHWSQPEQAMWESYLRRMGRI